MAFNFCNRLLECTYACGSWFANDCVYELGLFHTAFTIFRCLHDDTWLSETCKEQAGTELNPKLNTHATNLEHQSQHQRHLLGYPHSLAME